MKIVVYCSSVDNLPDAWQEATRAVGHWIGQNGAQLIYGGVDSGLMHTVALATKEAGGKVVGIVPARRRALASPLNDEKVPTSDLNERKSIMQMLGDAFVVLPGGYGTLDEFMTSFSYLNFTMQRKPIIIHNADGIFDHVLAHLKLMAERGLMPAECLEILTETHTTDQLVDALNSLINVEK
ncbi:MAG: TIGR00730 family Rossman fold protein [Muribaculaceae bacterium]|nr:TIGR00730 family Rossman fold protein [Muribaculaceae bacterium]